VVSLEVSLVMVVILKEEAKSDEAAKETGETELRNSATEKKEEVQGGATQNLVLDGADLLQSAEGGSVTLELTGGLAIESVDMGKGIITLTLDGASEGTAAAALASCMTHNWQ